MIEALITEVRKKPNHFDVEDARMFREALCATFCNRKGLGKCRHCPADKLDHATYKSVKIGDLINAIR